MKASKRFLRARPRQLFELDIGATPVVPMPVLNHQPPIMLVFDHRDLGIEMAYERVPDVGGTRVRWTTRDTTQFWIPRQTPVFAVSGGVIAYARKHDDGHVVIVDHGNGWLSAYRRLAFLVDAPADRVIGCRVSTGDVLGFLEPSYQGLLFPLRFELWKRTLLGDHEPIDPLRYIRRWRSVPWNSAALDRTMS